MSCGGVALRNVVSGHVGWVELGDLTHLYNLSDSIIYLREQEEP